MSATPTPWFADPDERPGMEWNWHICAGEHDRVCFMSNGDNSEVNAALIVKAVNAYQPMLEALEAVVASSPIEDSVLPLVLDAIALAKGETA